MVLIYASSLVSMLWKICAVRSISKANFVCGSNGADTHTHTKTTVQITTLATYPEARVALDCLFNSLSSNAETTITATAPASIITVLKFC